MIPNDAIFKQAFTHGTDDQGTTYRCENCQVYFSQDPSLNDPSVTAAEIKSKSTLGVETSSGSGVWQQPDGWTPEQVLFVAYLVDDSSLPVPILISGKSGMVGLQVTNAVNHTLGTCSPQGTVISNQPVIVSTQTLAATGNSVEVVILDDPSLTVQKTATLITGDPAHTLEYRIDFANPSTISNSLVTLTDTLPANLDLATLEVAIAWNETTIGHATGEGITLPLSRTTGFSIPLACSNSTRAVSPRW